MALTEDLDHQARIEELAERIAKVFLYNQLCQAYASHEGPAQRNKIYDEMLKLSHEIWPYE